MFFNFNERLRLNARQKRLWGVGFVVVGMGSLIKVRNSGIRDETNKNMALQGKFNEVTIDGD